MGKLATTDTIFSIFQPRLSYYGICLLNIPPNGRYRQLSAGHPPDYTARPSADFVPCEARIVWYSAGRTASRQLRDTTKICDRTPLAAHDLIGINSRVSGWLIALDLNLCGAFRDLCKIIDHLLPEPAF